MQSSSFSSQPQKARRFDAGRLTTNGAGRKLNAPGLQKEDKNKNTIRTSSPRQAAIKGPTAPTRPRLGVQPRAPLTQPKFRLQKQGPTLSKTAKPKPKGAQVKVAGQKAPATPPPPPLPNNLPLDPNCNEPSLPCLCCDGRSPQDHNSMFNHNHNNNNTISLRQQMQLPPPPAPLAQRLDGPGAQAQPPSQPQNNSEHSRCSSANVENQKKVDEREHQDNKQNIKVEDDDDEESSGDIDIDDEEDDDDSDDEDDDTLVPSCCDCPPSLLEFSLSSSTSSSSTSISSCSDMESDCLDQSASICSSQDQENLCTALSPKDSVSHFSNCQPPARSLPSLPVGLNPFSRPSHSSSSLSSLDEGYPSALDTPSPDYLGVKGVSEVKLGLLDFLESVGEFGKMERFSQIIQVARWDLDAEQHWDVMRDRLDHLDRLEKVHREVKLAYFARLHEKGFDLEDLEEQDLSDVMDEMGNIEIPWKFYKTNKGTMSDSQEFSDAGVDLTAPSDCDDPLVPDSLTPSPVEPPARPPKPPVRHASVSSDLHTYINISRETTSMAVTTSPLTTFSPNSTSPTFTTFRCEKPLPPSPPSIPPLPASKQVPYLTLYTTQAPTPSLPTPTPPIPPPRRRHLARKEAQRLAALQAEQEKTPLSLPPPTSRPPPLPPPPVISVTSSSPPAIPPPPSLPPPPSFHALDVEIRKLLMLAGLTQAELLKLSPELGVCVDALEDEGLGCIDSGSLETEGFRLQSEEDEDEFNAILTARDEKTKKLVEGKITDVEEQQNKQELKEIQRVTSFTEMARRRKKNTGPICDTYFSTSFSNTHEAETKKINFDTFHYPTEVPDSPPPPPPPRPLPPIPSSASPPKVSTLVANSKQPERFDWLIAFTPECESLPQLPPIEKRKSYIVAPKKLGTSSAVPESAPPPESAPKVTTFKELRFRNKSGSPPTKMIIAPEPDPTVITPDPDILYNLKWRKEKADSDGIQWEYTSQAQALFMQPPPALTSMAALQEMLQRADVEGRQPELCLSQKIGSSVSDSSLWTMGREWQSGEIRREEREQEKEEVRGRADGGRTMEMRTTVSSPPLSLAQSSQPYFLHSAIPAFRPGYCPSHSPATHRPDTHVGQEFKDKQPITDVLSDGFSLESLADLGVDSPLKYEDLCNHDTMTINNLTSDLKSKVKCFLSDSICNFDSLYSSESEQLCDALTESAIAVSDTVQDPGCTTPYKNIEVMMKFSNSVSATDSLYSTKCGNHSNKARMSKELPPLPSYYLYHPKNCPIHRGNPPRLSPIGALSPPHRSGAPLPGTASSSLSSPLFPRSHTLPALAAPLYYPNLYPPIPPRVPPLPPKLYQAPLQSHVATVRSVSFAGLVQKTETQCEGEDVKHPRRVPSLSAQCLQEKRALVSAVSVAVEAILAQFSSSRTVVQKTLSGDSTINPSLGRLVLQCFCPALHSLLTDGSKPHQSDLIAGRRPNSPWGLVQASTRPGPKTQLLFNLQVRVSELPQLRQSKHRFNAFLLGLLNSKLLDSWLLHLQSCSDVLDTFYLPTSFMRLSLSTCKPMFDELLLVLQPLSLLTFNLDLLFQHHHLEPDRHVPQIPVPQIPVPLCRDSRLKPSPQAPQAKIQVSQFIESLSDVNFGSQSPKAAKETTVNPKNEESSTMTNSDIAPLKVLATVERTSPQLLWVQEKEMVGLLPPNIEEESLAQQAGQVFQQGWGAVMRWGGRLSQNLSELSLAAVKKEEMMKADQPDSDYTPVSSGTPVPWGWGRLFGATKSPNSPTGPTPPTRRPSQWLAPGVTALTRMVSSSSAPTLRRPYEPQGESEMESEGRVEMEAKPTPLRSVRTLCEHTGTGSELSFCKGEELVVLGGVDQDWIRCRQGDKEGLVPIGYTSLIM